MQEMKPKQKTTLVSLSGNALEYVDSLSQEMGINRSSVVRVIITAHKRMTDRDQEE